MRRQLGALGEIVGWKMGLTVPAVQQHLGLDGPVLGHLPRSAVIEGGEHSVAGGTNIALEPELAIEIGDDGLPSRMGLAVEVVDLNRSLEELEEVLAGNVFHRAVAFGRLGAPVEAPQVRVKLNGEERDAARPDDPAETLAFVPEFLGRFGHKPEPGQLVIAGSLTPALPAAAGDVIELAADGLGELALRLRE